MNLLLLYNNIIRLIPFRYILYNIIYFSSDGGHPHIHHYYNYHPAGPPGRMHHVRISIGAPSGTIVNVSCNGSINYTKCNEI